MKWPANNERGPHHNRKKRQSYGNKGIKRRRDLARKVRAYARGGTRPKEE